jgi:hypothetical protein
MLPPESSGSIATRRQISHTLALIKNGVKQCHVPHVSLFIMYDANTIINYAIAHCWWGRTRMKGEDSKNELYERHHFIHGKGGVTKNNQLAAR